MSTVTVSITLEQTNEAIQDATDGSLTYRVTSKITATEGVSMALFVFDTLHQVYNHVATTYDLAAFPESVSDALALGLDFYRQSEVIRTFTVLDEAVDYATVVQRRLATLPADIPVVLESFTGTTTYTYTA